MHCTQITPSTRAPLTCSLSNTFLQRTSPQNWRRKVRLQTMYTALCSIRYWRQLKVKPASACMCMHRLLRLHKNDFLCLLQTITKVTSCSLMWLSVTCVHCCRAITSVWLIWSSLVPLPVNCRSTENGTTSVAWVYERGSVYGYMYISMVRGREGKKDHLLPSYRHI